MRGWRWMAMAGCAVAGLTVPAGAAARHVNALKVAGRVTAGPASLVLRQVALVSGQDAGGPLQYAGAELRGGTLAVQAFHLVGDEPGDESLEVFDKPVGGWSSAARPGTYAPVGGATGGAAVGDGAVAISEGHESSAAGVAPGSDVAVLVRPASGWSGAVAPSAHLQIPAGSVLPRVVAGDGFFATSTGDSSAAGQPIEVFGRPAGGWAGTVAPAAQLTASDGKRLVLAAAAGRTIIATDLAHGVYVFEEPTGGWSGVVRETARIPIAGGVGEAALSGDTLAVVGQYQAAGSPSDEAPLFVVKRPAGGWQTAARPRPRGWFSFGYGSLMDLAVAPGIVGIATGLTQSDHSCPCVSSSIWALAGLSSGATAPREMPVRDSLSLALRGTPDGETDLGPEVSLDGRTLAFAAFDGVHLESVAAPAPPRVSHIGLTGLTGGRPSLSLHVTARSDQPRVASLRVTMPSGLGISHNPARLSRGVTATGSGGVGLQRRDGYLVLTLRTPRPATTLRIGEGALTESRALRAVIGRIVARGGRRTMNLPVQITDQAGRASQDDVTLRVTQ